MDSAHRLWQIVVAFVLAALVVMTAKAAERVSVATASVRIERAFYRTAPIQGHLAGFADWQTCRACGGAGTGLRGGARTLAKLS